MKFPKHIQMLIHHNDHHGSYESINDYLSNFEWMIECVSPEDLVKCNELNELWEIQWYPNTPISFHKVISYSFERCLELALNIERKENETQSP
jgi:hypothetical protein